MRGVIYTRARTASLLQEQMKLCQDYAQGQAISVGLVLSDLHDGTSFDRPGLAALRAQANQELFEVVILYDYFALSRRLDQARELTRELLAAGLKVRFVMA